MVFHCGTVSEPNSHRVHHQPHRRLGREDVFLLRDELLEDVVLGGAAQLVGAHALLFGGGDVHGPDDGRGRVDGHAGGDLVERDAIQQDFHVLERRDRHAALAELAQRFGGVGVVAHQRGQVEGDGQAGLPLLEQVLEARVRLLGGAEAGEHAHRPQFAAVQRRVDAARVGIFAGQAQVFSVIQICHIQGGVQAVDRLGRGGDELLLALRHGGQRLLQPRLLPFFKRVAQLVQFLAVVHAASFWR